jgi:hypothetical protein
LRLLEIQYNDVFKSYCEAYYGKGVVSSVYLWNTDTNETEIPSTMHGFSACFVIQKMVETDDANDPNGVGFWNSVHVVVVVESTGGNTTYKMKSNAFVSVENSLMMRPDSKQEQSAIKQNESDSFSKASIDAALSRQVERSCKASDGSHNHLAIIGKMIEEVENEIRSSMESVHIPKTKEISESLHATRGEINEKPEKRRERKQQVSMELNEEMLARILKKSVTSPL